MSHKPRQEFLILAKDNNSHNKLWEDNNNNSPNKLWEDNNNMDREPNIFHKQPD